MSFLNNANKDRTIYYNVNAVNTEPDSKQLIYNSTRSSNLIDKIDGYDLVIPRFQIDLSDTPVIIFPTDATTNFTSVLSSNVNNNYWSITLQAFLTPATSQTYIQYLDYGYEAPYIYNINHFCDMLNIALKTSSTAIGDSRSPYFVYNKTTSSIDLYLHLIYRGITANHQRIYVNKHLYEAFCRDFNGAIVDLSDGRYFEIFVGGTGDNDITTTLVEANGVAINTLLTAGYVMTTYYPNLGNLMAVRSIVFTTSTMPIVEEQISNDIKLYNNSEEGTLKILKDFELNLEGANATHTRGIQNYIIPSEFQVTEMRSGGVALKQIDLQVFWKDKYGRLHPLYIPSGSNFTMKLMFRKH